MALSSSYTWTPDPVGNNLAAAGRTDFQWVRAQEDPAVAAVAKFPPPGGPREIYTMGMERVASELGRALGLSIPEVWLDDVAGRPAAVVDRIPETLTWARSYRGVDVATRLGNRSWWPAGVVFDVWIANVDRVERNLLLQPLPEGIQFAAAQSFELWLIDHGMSGLYWSSKFDAGLPPDRPDQVQVGDGEMLEIFERRLRELMPRDYQTAYWAADDQDREAALDRIRSVADDDVDVAVDEIPDAYMSPVERDKTKHLLKARRDQIDNLMSKYPW